MSIKIIDHNSKLYKEVVALRLELLRKPLGLHFTDEELELESTSIHIAAYDEDVLLGTCILIESSNDASVIKLRQMAVKEGLQRKGIGRSIVHFAEQVSKDKGFKMLAMHARKSVAEFYVKMGYTINGNEFTEVGIPHYLMEKVL
jgi:predicted GNAT family N-acyltransferase